MSQQSYNSKARQLPLNPLYKVAVCCQPKGAANTMPVLHSQVVGRTTHQVLKNVERRVGLVRQVHGQNISLWLEYNGQSHHTLLSLKAALAPLVWSSFSSQK